MVKVKPNDIFLTMSDGALYAGVGKMYNYGWQRDNIIDYLEARYEPDLSAKMACTIIAEECDRLYDHAPGDDTTVAAIRIRPRQTVSLMIGPPEHPEDDQKAVEELLDGGGKTIVCGGTTSNLVARVLDKPLIPTIEYFDPEIPPTAKIQGIDLVTEGVITIGHVLKLAKGYLRTRISPPPGPAKRTVPPGLPSCSLRRPLTSGSSWDGPSTPPIRTPTCPSALSSRWG